MDEEEFFSGSAGRITGRRVCFSFLFSLFFVITPGTTRALLYLRWFYSFRRACFYKLFLFPFFINFRSRYIREFCSMNLLTTRPRVEPRLIIHAWSCISQPSSERKNCIMRIVAPFSLSLSLIEFPFPKYEKRVEKFFIYPSFPCVGRKVEWRASMTRN